MGDDETIYLTPLQEVIVYGKQGETLLSQHAVSQNTMITNRNLNELGNYIQKMSHRMSILEQEVALANRFMVHAENQHPGIINGWRVTEAAVERLGLNDAGDGDH